VNSVAAPSSVVLIDPSSPAESPLAGRLQMQGYTVAVAQDPAEGARIALADPPAAVIADLWMPGISGVQLCRLLKAEPATEHVPVILRGRDSPRNRYWSERAGASAYVVKGRMGDLVRALLQAIAATPSDAGFFTTFAGQDIRERIAAHLDAALFESVLSAELRALSTCGAFDRLFDLFSQFLSRVVMYRWVAVATEQPPRIGIHCNPNQRITAEAEATEALEVDPLTELVWVEDDDAYDVAPGPRVIVKAIELGGIHVGKLAISPIEADAAQDESLIGIIARELGGPIRMTSLMEESQRLATVDGLTSLMNRRAFVAALEQALAVCNRYGHELSLILLDVDHFKQINDRFGHKTGDLVLVELGRHLKSQVRASDMTARWGGEEFVVALTCTGEKGALLFAERLRRSIEGLSIPDAGGSRVPVTASIGVSCFRTGQSLEALVDRSDKAMYLAKSSGRNRVALPPDDEAAADAEERVPLQPTLVS
jgi:two-component system cell cycle response regulator